MGGRSVAVVLFTSILVTSYILGVFGRYLFLGVRFY